MNALNDAKALELGSVVVTAMENNAFENAWTISGVEAGSATVAKNDPPTQAEWQAAEDEAYFEAASAHNADLESEAATEIPSLCFPGEAAVHVIGRGDVRLSDLQAGDHVLDKSGTTSEPVLGFLHAVLSQSNVFLTVIHSRGEFRASANHIVFANEKEMLVANAQVGDHLFVAEGKSLVLSVRRSISSQGMFAPLTASGMIVVDGVFASNYAAASTTLRLPHSLAHAVLFPTRMYQGLQLSLGFSQTAEVKEVHPFLGAMFGPLSSIQSWLLA